MAGAWHKCVPNLSCPAVFLEKIAAIMLFLIEGFVHSEVILANSSPIKLIFISLDENQVLLPVSSISIGFGA